MKVYILVEEKWEDHEKAFYIEGVYSDITVPEYKIGLIGNRHRKFEIREEEVV